MTHVIMYSLADKYNVAGMKDLCKEKFIAAAKTVNSADDLWDALEAIQTTTPSSDKGLRSQVLILIRNRAQELYTQKRFDSYMHKYGGVAVSLLKKAYSDCKDMVNVTSFNSSHIALKRHCSACKKITPVDVHYLKDQERHLIRCGVCRTNY